MRLKFFENRGERVDRRLDLLEGMKTREEEPNPSLMFFNGGMKNWMRVNSMQEELMRSRQRLNRIPDNNRNYAGILRKSDVHAVTAR